MTTRPAVLVLFVPLLASAIPGSAGAADPAGKERLATAAFAVPKDASGQKAAAAVGAILKTRLAGSSRLRLIEPGRVLSGDPRTREEENLDRAKAALADGRKAYDALSLDDAIARLGQAVTLFQEAGPLLGDLTELKTALMHLGAALTLRGSAEEGLSNFLELLIVDPSYSHQGFPPSVSRVFEQALDRLNKAPTGSAEIYSTPPNAAVYLDGEFRGVTPLSLTGLGAGTHYVRLEKDGYVVYGGPIEVPSKQRVTNQTKLQSIKKGAELRDLLGRAPGEIEAEGMPGNLRSLARLLTVDRLIAASVAQSGQDATVVGAVFDAVTATRLRTERAVLSLDSLTFRRDLEAFVGRLLQGELGGATGSEPVDSGGGFGLGTTGGGSGGAGSGGGGAGAGGAGSGGGAGGSAGAGGAGSGAPGYVPPTTAGGSVSDGSPDEGAVIGWSMVALGAAGVITGVVFAILAKGTHQDYLATQQASPDLPSIRDTGKTQALVADIGMFGGAALAVSGGLVVVLTRRSEPTPAELLGAPGMQVSGTLLDGGAMLMLGGELP